MAVTVAALVLGGVLAIAPAWRAARTPAGVDHRRVIPILFANSVLDTLYWGRAESHQDRLFFEHSVVRGGGFGPNVARALRCLGEASRVFMTAGGATGSHLLDVLRDEGLSTHVDAIAGETRHTTHWIDGDRSRMLVSPSPAIPADTIARLFAAARASGQIGDLIFVGGSVPHAAMPAYQSAIAALCRDRAVCVDIRTDDWLPLAAAGPRVLRVPDAAGALDRAIAAGAQIAVASEHDRVHVATSGIVLDVEVTRVATVTPFGAGDCLMAVFAALERRHGIETAARRAVAAASASVLDPLPGHFDACDAARLEPSLRLRMRTRHVASC
jgi:fructose-1-phosphate kinase PfkB-like protein